MFINKLKNKYKENKGGFFLIILFFIFSATSYELFNRPFGTVRNIEIGLDAMIPFIKEFIIIYHTFMLMVIVTGFILFVYDQKEYYKYVISLFIAQIIAYVIFMTFQTYVPRYPVELLGDDLFSKLVAFTYSIDNSYSGIPSMHVADMTLACIALSKSRYMSKIKPYLIAYMILIAITTVLVKQHVILDLPGGFILAVICYIIVDIGYRKYKEKDNGKSKK